MMRTEIGTQLGAPTTDGRSVMGLRQAEPAYEENKSRIEKDTEFRELSMLHTETVGSQSP